MEHVIPQRALIAKIFELRELAEAMVTAAGVHPEILEHLMPGPMLNKAAPLYQAHVAEILERVGTKTRLHVPTAAELCLGCMGASLKAPPVHAGLVLYDHVFFEVFGRRFGEKPREEWPGQIDEMLYAARRGVHTDRPKLLVRKHHKARPLP